MRRVKWIIFAVVVGIFAASSAMNGIRFAYERLGGEALVVETEKKKDLASAAAYIAVDLSTGEMIASKRSETVLPIASITKLATALVALKYLPLEKKTVISESAVAAEGGAGGLRAGEIIKLGDLLYPLLMESSNDAAEALSEFYGREDFIALMNKEAKAIGLSKTHFDDPSGLSSGNTSTASDVARLGRYIYNIYPRIFDITKEKEVVVGKHRFVNPTHFLNLSAYEGGKNGFTYGALKTSVSIFSTESGSQVVIAVLKSNDRDKDVLGIVEGIEKLQAVAK